MQNHPEITEDQINAIMQTVASTGKTITRDQAIQFIKNTYAELEMEKSSNVTPSVVEGPLYELGKTKAQQDKELNNKNWKNRIKNLQNKK